MRSSPATPEPVTDGVPHKQVRAQLEKIVASEIFSRSQRLVAFLSFVVEEALAGRGTIIKEQVLAVELYGKRHSSSGENDPVIRVDARRLRDKLREYYGEFDRDPVIISLPKGGYAPVFQWRTDTAGPLSFPAAPTETAQVALEPAAKRASVTRNRPRMAIAVGIAALLTVGAVSWLITRDRPAAQPSHVLSIAVLPFRDLTAAQDKGYLCDSLTEELIASLTSVANLRVASIASVSRYKGSSVDVVRVGRELNAQVLLEGSLRIEGDRARIIARLLNTRDGFHLWTFRFNGQIGQSSDIQSQAAEAILRRFRSELKTTQRALVQPPGGNSEAWHHYIRAAFHSRAEPLKSLEHYHAAVSADPGYALAWAGLSLVAVTAVDWGEAQPAEMFPKALDAARRALALTPQLPEAHQAIGRLKVYDEHDWAGAEAALRKAIGLDPGYQAARLDYAALVLVPTGRFHEAVLELRRALALYPDEVNLWSQLASALIKARRYEEAMEALDASRKIHPVQLALPVFSGMAASGAGDYDGALANFEQAASNRRTPWVLSHLGHTYARLGRLDDARRVIAELDHRTPGKPAYDYEIAAIYAALGDRDAAFAALDRAVANRSHALVWLKVDYLLDSLRPDARFRAFLQKMRLE